LQHGQSTVVQKMEKMKKKGWPGGVHGPASNKAHRSQLTTNIY
jgi:hypothetical protein